MNILMISGSRNRQGQTARAAEALLAAAEECGAGIERVFLPELAIERCRQCDLQGWGICRSEGRCIIDDDDFDAVMNKVRHADALVVATPVYFGDLSESLRAFLDRLRRTCIHEDGQADVAGKPVIGLCVAGGSGGGAPACADSLQKVLQTGKLRVMDVVPVKRQNLGVKCEALKRQGPWLAKGAPAS